MPNVSDVRPTSHDRHDSLLVAALAAGDLAGTDRDRAIELIETCVDCATLHDDLLAIARATATVPPPIATRPRDFRLSREQAARLRPSGWRRLVGAFGSPQLAFAKPLGVGLTTIGLAGLLLGNLSMGLGSAASAPVPRAAGDAAYSESAPSDGGTRGINDGVGYGSQVQPGASAVRGPVYGPSSPAASRMPLASAAAAASAPASVVPSSDQVRGSDGSEVGVAGEPKAATPGAGKPSRETGGAVDQRDTLTNGPDPRTVIFATAILAGLGLLVLRRVGRRVAAS